MSLTNIHISTGEKLMTYKENTKENHERDLSLNGIKTLGLFSIKFLIVSAAQKKFDLQGKFLK